MKKQIGSISDVPRKIYAMMILVRIYDEYLDEERLAVKTCQEIIEIQSDYLPAINTAIEIYEKLERWPNLVVMMKIKGSVVHDLEERVSVWLAVAELLKIDLQIQERP